MIKSMIKSMIKVDAIIVSCIICQHSVVNPQLSTLGFGVFVDV
jgi:hypothetical protein